MEIPNLSGYYIDINKKEYNSFGNGSKGEGGSNCYELDIYKQVVLKDEKRLEEAPKSLKNIDVYGGEIGDSEYEPIGYRIGDLRNNINAITFSDLTIGKNINSTIVDLYPNQYGIIIEPNDIATKISINPLSNSNDNDPTSKLFYQNFQDILFELNQHFCLSIGSVIFKVNSSSSPSSSSLEQFCQIPGIENESIYKILEQDPIKFINNYCNASNRDYLDLKKFIQRLHSIFNLVNWSIDLKNNPALLFLISNIYREINEQHRDYQLGIAKRLEYIINLPFNLSSNHLNQSFSNQLLNLFKGNNQFQKPCLLNVNINNTNNNNYNNINQDKNNDIFKLIINSIFNNDNSINIFKSLLNNNSEEDNIMKQCYLTININQYEPISKQIINEEFISKLVLNINLNKLNGLILYKDRSPSLILPSNSLIQPSTIKFDESLTNLYSKENQIKTMKFLEKLNNIKK
ncbi:hypothetical protein RB653_000236 [Dictyostelium firmibasis]|uniref:Uncharacterized protein n=1 Tax=Dictyostelium firmibasis TaxID=79012 RepID=A0AAN7YXR2_9MYCE